MNEQSNPDLGYIREKIALALSTKNPKHLTAVFGREVPPEMRQDYERACQVCGISPRER